MIDQTKEIFRWGPIPGRFYYISEYLESISKIFGDPKFNKIWPESLLLFRDGKIVWISQMTPFRSFGKTLFQDYVKNAKGEEIYKKWKEKVNQLLQFQKNIDSEKLKSLNDKELKELIGKFFQYTVDFWSDTLIPEFANYGSEEVLRQSLATFISRREELNSAMEILSAPEKPSFYQEEEIDLAEARDIKKHQQDYFWLQNSYAGIKILGEEYFASRARKINKTIKEEVAAKLKKTIKLKREITKKFSLSIEVIHIATTISNILSWQDERKKYIFINLHYKDLILREITRRFRYNYENLLNAGYLEIISTCEGEKITKIVHEREEGLGIHLTPTWKELSLHDTLNYWEQFVYENIIEKVDHFEGIIASKGKESMTRGKVRIVLDPFKEKNFKKGEILVTPMTSPEYVFLMEKAAAIVTDSGGLTCHAAIVSREFEIPCIVGTKVATQVLKDGDLIEVNTNSGTVTILQKA